MAIPTFPALPGLSFPVKKSPGYTSIVHRAVNGVTTGQSLQPYPEYRFELPFEFLRADDVLAELQTLMGFYQLCRGRTNPFHFTDPDDNAVTLQGLGVGDGATTAFALLRTLGALSVDPIQDAVAAGMQIFVNGVAAPFTTLATAQYGTIYGVNITTPPPVGQVITATFTYNWLCRFDDDALEFKKFTLYRGRGLYDAQSVKFTSLIQ